MLGPVTAGAEPRDDGGRAVGEVSIGPQIVRLPVREGRDVRFSHLARTGGLSQTRVTRIVQDDLGFIWFATQYGLDRFDGYNFKSFVHEASNQNSLSGVDIFSLFKDRADYLWIGCAHALDKFDPQTGTFRHFRVDTADTNRPDVTVRNISQDHAGMLWLSTTAGLYKLDPSSGRTLAIRHDPAVANSLSSDDVKFTAEDRQGAFWVADGAGLEEFDRSSGTVVLRIAIPEDRDLSFFEDTRGVFWILYASGNGLATFDRATRQLTRYTFNDQDGPGGPLTGVIAMTEDQTGTLWFATLSDGILKLGPDRRSFVRYRHRPEDPESVGEDRLTALLEDREGNIWAGLGATEPDVFASEQAPFKTLPFDPVTTGSLGESLVNSLYEDREGNLWVGMTGTLKRLDRQTGRYTHFRVPEHGVASDVISMAEDKDGRLWIGTSGQGLYQLDPASGYLRVFRHREGDPTTLSNDVVQRLLIDHAGTLWATTWDGFDRFNARTQTFKTYQIEPRAKGVAMPIAEDGAGRLWLGGPLSGLVRFDPEKEDFRLYRYGSDPPSPVGSDKVNVIHVEGPGAIWAGTQNGLYKINPESGATASYFKEDGLPSNAVSCVLDDHRGNLWLSTNQGVSRFNEAAHSFQNYSVADGLPGPDLTGWWACFKGRHGEIFFGGFSGAAAFWPDQVTDSQYSPPVVLTEFSISGPGTEAGSASRSHTDISYAAERTVSYRQNSFAIGFSALSFRSPSTNRYRYMLAGLDTNWHEVSSDRRIASYTTLPAGAYTFRVQGATSRGPWSQPGAALHIIVLPPWWATWWFRSVYVVLAVLVFGTAYVFRVRHLSRQMTLRMAERIGERTRIARDLHDTLLQGLLSVQLQISIANNLIPPDSRAKSLVERVGQLLRQMIDESRNTVRGLRVRTLIEQGLEKAIREIPRDLGVKEEVVVELLVEGERRSLRAAVHDEVYWIAREALANAIRHAQASRIEVELEYSRSRFRLAVRDDGRGIDPQLAERRLGHHWGMSGMAERAARIQATLNVSTAAGAGTEVDITIPADIAFGPAVKPHDRSYL